MGFLTAHRVNNFSRRSHHKKILFMKRVNALESRRSSRRDTRRRSKRDVYEDETPNIPKEHRRKLLVPNFMTHRMQLERCELSDDTLKISPYLDTYRFFNERNNMSYGDKTFLTYLEDRNNISYSQNIDPLSFYVNNNNNELRPDF